MSIGAQWLNVIPSVIIDYGLMDILNIDEILPSLQILYESRTDFTAGLDFYIMRAFL